MLTARNMTVVAAALIENNLHKEGMLFYTEILINPKVSSEMCN